MKPHKWEKEIKAWADGAEIECRQFGKHEWHKTTPQWNDFYEYRIKPQPKEPQYLYVYGRADEFRLSDLRSEQLPFLIGDGKIQILNYKGKIKLETEE
jgi:hypothetical protein